jgi:hypothetical protein
MRSTEILRLRDDEPVLFAAEELTRCLEHMDGELRVEVRRALDYRPDQTGIWLGMYEDFGLAAPDVESPEFDDRIHVEVKDLSGVIAGSNPRSVLLGVYRLLTEMGCRWVRPGRDGEYIPTVDASRCEVALDETPSYRHRGVCIEGAVSYENVAEMIDWAPKVGLNGYFFQFIVPFTFYDRWYRHPDNPTLSPQPLAPADVLRFKTAHRREMARRGLAYHAVGHGWTCEPFGIAGLGWEEKRYDVSDEVRSYLAEVNGEHAIWEGIPLNTNLCWSNPEVRRKVVDYAVQTVQGSPDIAVLHVWLADGANNHCECPECRAMLPADWYVRLLNEMDAAFTVAGIPAKIVFLAYLDLLWAPERERLHDPGRFILMFAPISRSYSRSYDLDTSGIAIPPYVRNRLTFPRNVPENLAFLRAWQKLFEGDSFTFEYHFMWDHHFDPGYYEAARVLHADIRRLHDLRLNGFMSCQNQRAFWPAGFGMHVLARTLWDENAGFETLAETYFRDAFGPDGDAVRAYLAELSRLFDPPYLRGDKTPRGPDESHIFRIEGLDAPPNAEAARNLAAIPAVLDAFAPVIARNRIATDPCRAQSWEYLAHHAAIARSLARAFQARAEGDPEAARAAWDAVVDYARRHEPAVQPVFDVHEFVATVGSRFR